MMRRGLIQHNMGFTRLATEVASRMFAYGPLDAVLPPLLPHTEHIPRRTRFLIGRIGYCHSRYSSSNLCHAPPVPPSYPMTYLSFVYQVSGCNPQLRHTKPDGLSRVLQPCKI